ncbi:hypothetical protein IW261DRAFT_1597432 [Armillaria novae-zelandiae]|uniref:Glycoside hydrolase family 76 protein n=1 Tax=Armillaria novae-zelandiae TaxID=153914 RepID=A0AA39NSY8_9AGAR|nr:hypothetical protein IW261DRAFT_1597432 [Armillaria novae-zelandiae]
MSPNSVYFNATSGVETIHYLCRFFRVFARAQQGLECFYFRTAVSVFRGRSSLWVASWHYSNFIVSRLTFTIRLNTPRAASLPEAQMRLVFISTLLALSSYSAAAEDPKPPTTWTVDTLSLVENSQNVTQSWDERISNASASLQQAITMVNQTHGQFNVSNGTYADAGALYAQMVEYDRLTNQTKYKVILRDYFTVAESKNPGFLDVQNYGYAAAHAYTVYQDPFFLTLATTSWASARRYTISQKQADSGTIGTKNFNLSSCHSSLVGGTFSVTDCNDPFLDSLASGVSALLAEAAPNQMYIEAATASAKFLQSNLLSPSSFVSTGMESSSDKSSSCSKQTILSLCGVGSFIEGLAILAASNIPEYVPLNSEASLNSAVGAVLNASMLHAVNASYEDSGASAAYIVRGLVLHEHKNASEDDISEYIHTYIQLQPVYGDKSVNLTGSNSSANIIPSSMSTLLPPQSSPKSSDIPTSSVSTSLSPTASGLVPPEKKNSAGIIAGSVVGAIIFLAAFTVVALFFWKLCRQRNNSHLGVQGSPSITPFLIAQHMPSSEILVEQHQVNRVKSVQFPEVTMVEDSSPRATDNGLVEIPRTNTLTEPTVLPRTMAANHERSPPPGNRTEHILMEELLKSFLHAQARISHDRQNPQLEGPPDYYEGYAM